MQVEVDPDAVLSCPLNGLEEISAMNEMSEHGVGEHGLRVTYVQHVLAKKGSSPLTSIAQYGSGMRTQFSPAAAISAKSCSVLKARVSKELQEDRTSRETMDVR